MDQPTTKKRLTRAGIVLGLTIIYAAEFPALHNLIGDSAASLSALPVAAAGWYFGFTWAMMFSLLIGGLNIFLFLQFSGETGSELLQIFPTAFVVLLFVGTISGYLHQLLQKHGTIEVELRDRERFLEKLNNITTNILTAGNVPSILPKLILDLTDLFNADACYFARWDPVNNRAIPALTTETLPQAYDSFVFEAGEANFSDTVLKGGKAVAVDDVSTSELINQRVQAHLPCKSVLGIPLCVGEQKLGVAIIAFNTHHTFAPVELRRAEQAGHQVALALQNVQQGIELQRRLNESNVVAQIGHTLGETERVGLGEVLHQIVKSTRELIPNAEQSVIHLVEHDQQLLIPHAVIGYDAPNQGFLNMRIGEGVAGRVVLDGKAVSISNVENDERFLRQGPAPRFQSLMVCPIQSGGNRLGTISVQSGQPNAFSTEEERLLNLLGTEAAIAIENARLLETTQQSFKEVNALYHITRSLAATLEPEELMKEVVEHLQHNFGYYQVQIFIVDPQNGNLVVQCGSNANGEQLKGEWLPAGSGIVGHTAETGKPFFTNDVEQVLFFVPHRLMPETHSELAVPIKLHERVSGILDIQHRLPSQLTERDLQLVNAVAEQLAVALQKAELYSNLQASLQQEKNIRTQLVHSERLAVVGRLLASVSHELNNPLQAIQNALYLLKDEQGISPQGRQDLQIVLSEAERMAALIERLRASYRPPQPGDQEAVQVNTLIEDTYTLLAAHMRHHGVAFEFHPDTELPKVLGRSGQLRQVILNLFMNAVEAMPTGGAVTISTELTAEHEVLLTVVDTGPGIAPEILPHVFDAFVTNKTSGTGLGLAISYEIINNHKGRISAGNMPNGGGVFQVWLPAYLGEQE